MQSEPNVSLHLFSEETPFEESASALLSANRLRICRADEWSDYYGAHFLTDLMHAFHYTDAILSASEPAICTWNLPKQLMLVSTDKENRYVDRVSVMQ